MSFLQSRPRTAREGFGKPVLRKEDARLLVGGGCYSDDVNLDGQAYACFVRSPHAHALIRRVDTAAALATLGVIAVLTGADAASDGVKPLTHSPMPGNPHEDMIRSEAVAFIAPHPPIAADRARFVGEIVAIVVADTPAAARDGAGGLGRTRTGVAGALGVPESGVRVIAREVGGNFGTRNSCYPGFGLVAWAARRLGRPVKWTAERREALLADYHGRDLVSHAELALDATGAFLGFRAVNTSNVGAHAVSFHPLNKGMAISSTVYHVPAVSMRGRAVVTNTSPTTPYRSAGRPEGMFVMERLIDLAARIDLVLGTLSSGQGHATSFAQLLVEWLGVELDEVRLITGDTDVTVTGGGAHSARALRLAAVVMAKAADQIVEQGKKIAANLMEAAEADIEFSARRFRVKGTDRSVDLYEVAKTYEVAQAAPLDATSDETMPVPSFPYGCAACQGQVDPETGVVELVSYTTVDDC